MVETKPTPGLPEVEFELAGQVYRARLTLEIFHIAETVCANYNKRMREQAEIEKAEKEGLIAEEMHISLTTYHKMVADHKLPEVALDLDAISDTPVTYFSMANGMFPGLALQGLAYAIIRKGGGAGISFQEVSDMIGPKDIIMLASALYVAINSAFGTDEDLPNVEGGEEQELVAARDTNPGAGQEQSSSD